MKKKILKIIGLSILSVILLFVIVKLFYRLTPFKPFCEKSGGEWFEGYQTLHFDGSEGAIDKSVYFRNCNCFYQFLDNKRQCYEPFDYKRRPSVQLEVLVKDDVSLCTYKPDFFMSCRSCTKDEDCDPTGQRLQTYQNIYGDGWYREERRSFCDKQIGACRNRRKIFALPKQVSDPNAVGY